jgi:hypothetical protein
MALYRAKHTFVALGPDGKETWVRKDELVREGHWVLSRMPDAFEMASGTKRLEVEDATAEPGVKRGRRTA